MEKTLQIITLFSNHMRYVFHDSLSLVTVRAELDEVNDYFRIIQSERSDAIVLNQNVDQELLDFKIPPLTIQTFLENFNKFNAPSSKILRFSIRIDKVEMDDRFYVRLRLSDNGVGYSEEALTKIQVPDKVFERYHIGTQNLCRRLDLLYKDKYQIAFFNNPGGGASSVIYLPLEDK
jgi:LytS/YehU family sensor histidine kinase